MDYETIRRINSVLPHLDERQKRIYLAAEAEALGRGGAKEISKIFGIHQNTLTAGKKDLQSGCKCQLKIQSKGHRIFSHSSLENGPRQDGNRRGPSRPYMCRGAILGSKSGN